MNILYLHQYFNTPEMPGSTRSYEFAKRLVSDGHNVYMVTTNWQSKSKKKFSIENGIKVFWGPIKYSNKMNFCKRLVSFLSYIIYSLRIGYSLKFDLIIASSTPITVGIPAIILKKIKSAKLIFEVRDVWPQLPIAIGAIKSKIIIKTLRALERKIYLESDKIIALSKGMKKEILKVIINEKKVCVITNLCDIKNFNINKREGLNFRKNFLNIKNEPLILYAGTFGKINNAIYLVEIAKHSKDLDYDIKFLMVGNGYQKNNIIKKAESLDVLNKNLFVLNYFPKNELPALLSASTIVSSLFIDLPEMQNNSANKFFDALAAGKPVMLNYHGWQYNLIKKNEAGFAIPNNDPNKAIGIINNYISNKEKIKNMCLKSKELSKNFTIEKNYVQLKKTIDAIFEG